MAHVFLHKSIGTLRRTANSCYCFYAQLLKLPRFAGAKGAEELIQHFKTSHMGVRSQ